MQAGSGQTATNNATSASSSTGRRARRAACPCPPELTVLLHEHLARFGTAAQGRVFAGDRGGELPSITYARVWRRARETAFKPDVAASPLAARPYDLRHARRVDLAQRRRPAHTGRGVGGP